MNLSQFLGYFEKVKPLSNGEHAAICPAHADKTPSLHIRQEKNRILLNCKAGCSPENILEKIGLELHNLFIEKTPGQQIAEYDYHDEHGNVLYQVVRFEPKAFKQRHRNGKGDWVWDMKGVTRVLYHLPEVMVAEHVYLVEGEKDADNLRKKGLTATTSPGGTKSWKPEYAEWLIGKQITIIPDTDAPGLEYGRTVTATLQDRVSSLDCILLPNSVKDISDWLTIHSINELPQPQEINALLENKKQIAEIPIPSPEVTESIGRVAYLWPTLSLRVVVDRITEGGSAELWFYFTKENSTSALLHTTKVNLMSTPTMGQVAKRMSQHSQEIPWSQLLTLISARTMEYSRRGEPGAVISPNLDTIRHPGYFVEPLIMRGIPTVIYGDKGVNKTTLALSCLGLVALGYDEGKFGLSASATGRVALLDWESTRELTEFTLGRLIQGNTVPYFDLPYLRCRQPLADDIDRIANFLADNKVDVVAIDSLGGAAGADKFDSAGKASALRFFEALRQLNLTSLIIAQNAKAEGEKKTIYGSTYFTYYSRNIFELRGKADELDHDKIHTVLVHQEANYSAKYNPIGFCLRYTEDSISITSEIADMAEFYQKINQTKAVIECLKSGAQSRQAIAKALGIKPDQASVVLNRAKRKGLVMELGSGMWLLPTTREKEAEDLID